MRKVQNATHSVQELQHFLLKNNVSLIFMGHNTIRVHIICPLKNHNSVLGLIQDGRNIAFSIVFTWKNTFLGYITREARTNKFLRRLIN